MKSLKRKVLLCHWSIALEGSAWHIFGLFGEGENAREGEKSPQANLDSWVVFKACFSWRVAGVAEAEICYSIWSGRES